MLCVNDKGRFVDSVRQGYFCRSKAIHWDFVGGLFHPMYEYKFRKFCGKGFI